MQTGPGDKPTRSPKKKPKPAAPRRGGAADTWKQPGHTPSKTQQPPAKVTRPQPSEVKDTKSDADRGRADRYKKTKEYKRAVRKTYDERPTPRRSQIARNATGEVGEAIRPIHKGRVERNRELARSQATKDTKGNADRDRGLRYLAESLRSKKDDDDGGILGTIGDVLDTVYGGSKGKGKGTGGAAVSAVPMVATGGPARRARNIGLAFAGDPVAVSKNTVKSVPQTAAGTVGAVGSIINDAAHGRATTLKSLPGAAAKDYKRRYGSSDAEQIKQIKEEGVLADASDATAAVGGAGAAVGRALTPAAKAGRLGKAAEKVATEPRPKLRTTAGEGGAKAQDKSANLFVAAAQHARDEARKRKMAKQVQRHDEEGTPIRGVVPEGPDEVVRRSRRRQQFDQRKGVAGDVGRGYIRLKGKQDREVRQGIEAERREVRKATPRKQRGVVADVEQLALEGLINFDDAAKTRALLTARRAKIVAERKARKTKVPKSRKGTNDDLARVDRVIKALDENPEQVLSPALRDFHAKQVERHGRLREDDQIVDDLTADVRRYMPLARTTGDAEPFEAKIARIEEKHANGDFGKGDAAAAKAAALIDRARSQFVAQMKTKATDMGVSEPVYVYHRPRPTAGHADYAAGGSHAVAGPKKTAYKLHDTGTQDVTPAAYTQGVAKSIKRNVNWNLVADILERNAASWSRGTAGGGRKVETLRKELDARGLDERDWAIVDLGVYRKSLESATEGRGDDLAHTGEASLHDALTKATYDLKGAEAQFARTNRRFVVVPRAVANELRDMAKPAGTIRRGVQKFQGLQSRVLLNYNPTFVPIQVVANTPLALFAMRGNVKDLVAAQRWYKRLDPTSQDALNEFLGVSAGRSANMSPRMGAAAPDNHLVRGYQALVDSDRAQAVRNSRWNPSNWNPLLDDKQNAFFRKAVFYNEAKRQAARDMRKSARSIEAEAAPLLDILKMRAGEEKIRLLRQAEPQFEKIANHTDEWLGNYLRYTARERQYLKTALLFYGFLRWSIKFTFYTLPVKHPVATALMAKLGQLQNEEVIDLLAMQTVEQSGGNVTQAEAEAELRSGGFADAFGRVYITDDGKLKSIDLARVNPFTSALTNVMGGGVRALPGLLSPAVQAAFDLAYGRSTFRDQPLVMDGQRVERAKDITLEQGVGYVGRTLARTFAPVRIADNVVNPESQSDNSLPILGNKPRVYKSAEAQQNAAERREQKGSAVERLADGLIPLREKPDNTPVGVAIAAERRKRKQGTKVSVSTKPARPGRGGIPPLPALPELPPLPRIK
jgi:hypothetical protein